MAKRKSIPTYRLHRKTGRAVITVRTHADDRQDILLPGAFDSAESRQEYERLLSILRTSGNRLPPHANGKQTADLTINELALRFVEHHADYYSAGERGNMKYAFRPLVRMFGPTLAREFGPLALRSVQDAMATGSWLTDDERAKNAKSKKPLGLARGVVNQRIGKIKLLFKWSASMELIPASVHQALATVAGLRSGKSKARETAPVVPPPLAHVETVLPILPPVSGDIVQLLLLTGARVGEMTQLTTGMIDRTGPVWIATVAKHKTALHGHVRKLCFGSKAQMILRKYLKADPDALLFSPAEQDRIIKANMRAERNSKVQPSQFDRSKRNAKRKPRDHFDAGAINGAIRRACERVSVPRFHVHQLRHLAALLIEREFGPDAARSVLGHRTLNLTLHYSGIDTERAKEVAAKIG